MSSSTWHDAQHFKVSFQCLRKHNPIEWAEVLQCCKASRRFRKWWLKTCRNNAPFKLTCIWWGVKP